MLSTAPIAVVDCRVNRMDQDDRRSTKRNLSFLA